LKGNEKAKFELFGKPPSIEADLEPGNIVWEHKDFSDFGKRYQRSRAKIMIFIILALTACFIILVCLKRIIFNFEAFVPHHDCD
jgi:hypothetical protein